jgi:M6 family metalloprotease-like protein
VSGLSFHNANNGGFRVFTILLLLILVAGPFMLNASANREPAISYQLAPSFAMPLPPITSPVTTQMAPAYGTLRVLVVAAEFSDVPHTLGTDVIRQEFTQQVAAYYNSVSYGTVSMQVDVVGWVHLPYPQAYYGKDCGASIDDPNCSGQPTSWWIARDAAPLLNDSVNWNDYNYFMFVHSGYGEETTKSRNGGITDTVWSVTYLGGIDVLTSSRKPSFLYKLSIVPELEAGGAVTTGVYCHEFAIQLGLPDLYDTAKMQPILGPWSIMDKGTWNGNPPGSSPSHMMAWEMIKLGWINGSMLAMATASTASKYLVDPIEIASSNVHAIKIPITSDTNPDQITSEQYYLVEVRQHIGTDHALPSTGVLITYVDESLDLGKVKVIDGHPDIPNLQNATWSVGQVFTDAQNSVAISIDAQVGYSFQITVNRVGPLPDLAVSQISTQPSTISPNITVTITIGIINRGTKTASNVPVQVNLDDKSLSTSQVTVNPGATVNITLTWKAVAGTHKLQVVIDPQNTINQLSKANNVATYTLYVGSQPQQPQLPQQPLQPQQQPNATTHNVTIILPFTTGSAVAAAWVKINGILYYPNNSSQITTSVPSGNVTVEADEAIVTSPGVRESFTGWSDGINQNPRQVALSSDTTLQALYKTQYLITVYPNGGTATLGGWFDPNITVTIAATSPSNVTNLVSRMVFTQWSGDIDSNSTSLSITLTKPMTLKANWKMQYYINIASSVSSISGSGWYDSGTTATISARSPVVFQNNTRWTFAGWSGGINGQNPTTTLTVNAPSLIQAQWRTQYLVQVLSTYGNPQGAGWYDAGTYSQVSIEPQVDSGNRTRRVFQGWTGDYSGSDTNVNLRVDSPKALAALWNTQYEVKFMVRGLPNSTSTKLILNNGVYDLSVSDPYQGWFGQGDQINPVTNQTVHDQFMIYPFQGWRNSTGGVVTPPFTVDGPADYTAVYQSTFILPPLPGFPVESILAGVILGLLCLALLRRKKVTS